MVIMMVRGPNLVFLHDKPDPLVRKFVLQFIEFRKLIKFISHLKSQLLYVNVLLALVHRTQP